jgi:hypothetical protein
MKIPTSKLVNVLIAKSILETILVGTIAVVVYWKAFPPTFKGWGEAVVETQTIHGWVVNDAQPWDRVRVQLFIDGRFWKQEVATHNRPDVFAAGWGNDPYHGYGFTTPKLPPGIHDARVYALHGSGEGARYTLQLVGNPIKFRVENDGSWTTATDVTN